MEEWISLTEMAARRGCVHGAVQRAIRDGRIPESCVRRKPSGRIKAIEYHGATAAWSANTDPAEAVRSGAPIVQAPASKLELQAPAGQVDKPAGAAGGEATGDQGNFLAARIREAELRGQLLELDKFERVGELLPRDVVQREFSEIFAQLKNAAFRIPDRRAQAIAGETDPVRVHRMLSDELRMVFDEFSRRLTAPAAGVADDAGVAREREAVLP